MTAYGTDAGYKAWADARGVAYGAYTDAQIAAARLRASEFIDAEYGASFPGLKTSGRSQDRAWPRSGAYDIEGYSIASTVVPDEIVNATYEGTKRELASAGSLAPDVKAGGGVVTRVKAGSTEVEFANNGATSATFKAIRQALSTLIRIRSAYSGTVVRG